MKRPSGPLVAMMLCTTIMVAAPRPASAAFFDSAIIVAAVNTMNQAMNRVISSIGNQISSTVSSSVSDLSNPNSLSTIMSKGFEQNANYSKAQVGAQQRIADAQNTAMAGFQKRIQDANIRDEHMMNPEFCAGLDTQQAMIAASKAARSGVEAIAIITDARGESGKGTPSYYGAGQGVAANMALHASRYCSQEDVDVGICSSVSTMPNADQHALSLFGQDTLSESGGIEAANDYATTLIQPVSPAAIRGQELSSTTGRELALKRRSYNSRMSLARYVMTFITSLESPNVTLNDTQQAELVSEGLPKVTQASWLQIMSLEVSRRVSNVAWNASLQGMPPATVMREIAIEQAQSNYLALQNYRMQMLNASLLATRVAQQEEAAIIHEPLPMPSPNLSNGQ